MAERVRLTVDGAAVEAEEGTSLLAALWNGRARALRRSISGEPRGPLCSMGTCFECRVTVDGEPHVRSCLTPVRAGMQVRLLDPGGVPERAPAVATPDARAADVVIVGAGPAGIAAAVHAAEAGASTLVVDTSPRPGGQIWRHRGEPPAAARAWLERLEKARVARLAATVVDAAPGVLRVASQDGGTVVRFSKLVLATGARELFLPFPGWTLPGVIGAGGAQALVKAGARFAGLRTAVTGSGPLLAAVAATLAAAGARIVGVAEQAPLGRLLPFGAGLLRSPGKLREALGYGARLLGTPYRTGSWVRSVAAAGTGLRATVTDGRREWTWDCDVLACGYGLAANLELPRLLGCAIVGERVRTDPFQETSVAGVFAAGELGGIAGLDHALVTGAIAGIAAAAQGVPVALVQQRARERAFGARLARVFALREELRGLAQPETTVCRCEDVPRRSLDGASSTRDAKLATRAGMGPCQGRVCGAALGLLGGHGPDSVRPPLVPTTVGALLPGDPE